MLPPTIKETDEDAEEAVPPGRPGLVLIYADNRPYLLPFPLTAGRLDIGREELQRYHIEDERVSRRHVAVGHDGTSFQVRELGSTNGVFLDGIRLAAKEAVTVTRAVLRVGRTLFLLVPDLAPYHAALDRPLLHDGIIAGPALHAVHEQIAALSRSNQTLLLRGESGCGKEVAARLYHRSGPRSRGPLVAVNCATIPKELAERLLFGTVRGAYSGAAADAPGYLQAADGGTLFLDEVADLDLAVQAKLLRVLETREVAPLGGTRAQPIDIGICAATLRDLRDAVAAGKFRDDLHYRIGRPEVCLPPLRERLEEIPHLIQLTARAASGLAAGALFVEACLLRPWPGNIRELRAEVHAASVLSAAKGSPVVIPKYLAAHAGQPVGSRANRDAAPPPHPVRPADADELSPLLEALAREAGETLGAARKTVLKLLSQKALFVLHESAAKEDLPPAARARRLREQAAESLLALLSSHDYSQSEVAAALGISRTTLIKLMADLGVPRATELTAEEIARACAQTSGDLEAAARLLRISARALKKRLTASSA